MLRSMRVELLNGIMAVAPRVCLALTESPRGLYLKGKLIEIKSGLS